MDNQFLGVIIGGFVPAILFGISGLFQKSSQKAGISLALYVICIGAGVLLIGLILLLNQDKRYLTLKSGLFSLLIGLFWASATACVAIAIVRFSIPLSKLAPLYNMNTVVAVVLGFLIYAEWKEVNMLTLLCGTVLVVIGGILVARS